MARNRKIISLGLDISSHTGYAVLEDGELIDYGCFHLKSKDSYKLRYKDFRKEVRRLMVKHKPSVVVLEGVYVNMAGKGRGNPKTAAYLNALRGIAVECIPVKTEYLSIQVKKVRKEVLGSGNATKEDVFNWAVKKYNLVDLIFSKDNDITDSVLLSLLGNINLQKEKGNNA